MLLSVTMLGEPPDLPATDLGFLLHKHPDRAQSFDVASGRRTSSTPRRTAGGAPPRCCSRSTRSGWSAGTGRRGEGFALAQYVNDRPYAASSMLAVALGRVFRTAITGRCDARPELAATPAAAGDPRAGAAVPGRRRARRAALRPARLGRRRAAAPARPRASRRGATRRYVDLRLAGTVRLADALSHLYVLLPVLDDAKHYWVGPDEVDKLVRAAGADGSPTTPSGS